MCAASSEGDASSLTDFKNGFLRFKNEVVSKHKAFFSDLAAHQQPKVMVIGCCDSRVDPALLMGAGPGDIFVFRNIANMVPPYERNGQFHGTSAALEYAVLHLKARRPCPPTCIPPLACHTAGPPATSTPRRGCLTHSG